MVVGSRRWRRVIKKLCVVLGVFGNFKILIIFKSSRFLKLDFFTLQFLPESCETFPANCLFLTLFSPGSNPQNESEQKIMKMAGRGATHHFPGY